MLGLQIGYCILSAIVPIVFAKSIGYYVLLGVEGAYGISYAFL